MPVGSPTCCQSQLVRPAVDPPSLQFPDVKAVPQVLPKNRVNWMLGGLAPSSVVMLMCAQCTGVPDGDEAVGGLLKLTRYHLVSLATGRWPVRGARAPPEETVPRSVAAKQELMAPPSSAHSQPSPGNPF